VALFSRQLAGTLLCLASTLPVHNHRRALQRRRFPLGAGARQHCHGYANSRSCVPAFAILLPVPVPPQGPTPAELQEEAVMAARGDGGNRHSLTSHQISRTRTRGSVEAAELWRRVANSNAAGSAGHRAAPARLQ